MALELNLSKLLNATAGHFTAKTAHEFGISSKHLASLLSQGLIEKLAYGLYMGNEYFPDPFFTIQHKSSHSIFSHETALYLHDLSDRDPLIYSVTIQSGKRNSLASENNVQTFYNNEKIITLGITEVETPYGTNVRAFDIERTLCDCIKYIDLLDRDLVLTALKRYLKSSQRNSGKLLDYATELKIRDKVFQYLEVL